MTPTLKPQVLPTGLPQLLLAEFQKEAAVTRRVLERVPSDKLTWKPHAKSMSLGQLALHIATIPTGIPRIAQLDEFDVTTAKFDFPPPKDTQEILATLDSSVKAAESYIGSLSDASAAGNWRMTAGPKELFTITRFELLRSILLNHWYHHRGQLSVYLRLLDVNVPSIYGPSADENPFG